MTTTESLNYMIEVYLKNGWITPKQVKQINREAYVIAFGIILVTLLPAILILLLTLK